MVLETVTFFVGNFPAHCKLVLLLCFLLQINNRLSEQDLCDSSTLTPSDSSALATDEEAVQLCRKLVTIFSNYSYLRIVVVALYILEPVMLEAGAHLLH